MLDAMPGRPTPLRRVDRYALLAVLARKPRMARLQWLEKRQMGHIRAWPRAGGLSFRVEGGAAAGMGLPDDETGVELHFGMRGLSFCASGVVSQLNREQGRLMIKPETVEWVIRRLEIEGDGRVPGAGSIQLRGPDGKVHTASLLSLGSEAIRFVCWPCPRRLEAPLEIAGKIQLDEGELGLDLRIHQAQAVYPGCGGRILTAEPLDAQEPLQKLIAQLRNARMTDG
jgi:hypothetical protein